MTIGDIDKRCISARNEACTHAYPWRRRKRIPGFRMRKTWDRIKKHSIAGPAKISISGFGLDDPGHALSGGEVEISTSKDPVGAPIFYRDVPLMPSETEKGIIKPLSPTAIPLIEWRLRSIDQPESRVVLKGQHAHLRRLAILFSGMAKRWAWIWTARRMTRACTPQAVSIKPQTVIRSEDMISWNPTEDRQFAFNRVGFMSRVSPNGRYVLTMVTSAERPLENNFYVANFLDYKFLQVFYPTRGVLYWYDRKTGGRHPLPGADDPDYVQTNGVWSPDGKWVVFIRAKAEDPYPAGRPIATHSNDPNEIQIQYDVYRVPFNDGKGGIGY